MAYLVDVLTLAAILTVATHGYMLIKGLGGMLHLGHAVFYGLGAYAAAILSTRYLPAGAFPISIVGAAVAAALGALVIGWPALKERGRYFMIVTFSIQLIFVTFAINLAITGGPDGISSIPGVSFGPWQPAARSTFTLGPVTLHYAEIKLAVMIGFAILSFLACRYLILSPYGRLVRAVREDEIVVEAYGRSATRTKLSIFMIGAAVAGAAGGLFAHHFNYVGPTQFELDATVLFLVMLIVGGQYSLVGATAGAVLMIALLEILRFLLEDALHVPAELTAHLRQLFFAVSLILVLALRSQGLVPERLVRHRRAAPSLDTTEDGAEFAAPRMVAPKFEPPRDARVVAASFGEQSPTKLLPTKPVLTSKGLSVRFGGVQAVADAGVELRAGSITVIIGPNGAGKTSLFNILSGLSDSDGGEAILKGQSILGLKAAEIARLGLARTFQDVRAWRRLTTIENVLASRRAQPGANPLNLIAHPLHSRRAEKQSVEQAFELLERFGLQHYANVAAGELSYAQRKMLSLARISSFEPDVMLLDEPTSGVDPRRLDVFLAHIRSFARDDGRAICLIEHNMSVVRSLADWVLFMDEGRTLAAGRPEDILRDRTLMRVYLGHRELKSA
jgi:branched-chain amino acid transport system permease protein